ncbi:MAG: OmpA family protein [Marinovum sp.]|nr:OmpA family protein [Marinovum sp.]
MTKFAYTLISVAALTLAACTDGGRFDNDFDTDDGSGELNGAEGALGAAGDPTSPAYFSQTIGDRVFFEVDQAVLTTQGRATLDAQATWLMTNADYFATIEGHADEQGTREYNIGLSNRRAAAARDYLVAQGVPASRLTTVGFGKERPVAVCSEESCYAQNRRSVTILTGGLLG